MKLKQKLGEAVTQVITRVHAVPYSCFYSCQRRGDREEVT